MKLIDLAKHLSEVQDLTWDTESYIKFVLSPLEKAIKEMSNDDPHKDTLMALLSSGNEKFREMAKCIQEDIGILKIKTRGCDHGCFLGEKVIGTYIELTDNQSSVSAKKTPNLFLERRRYKRDE